MPYKKSKDNQGYVYFVRQFRFIKIGIASHLGTRMAAIQTDSPFPNQLLGYIPTTKNKYRNIENKLHKQFKNLSCGGEWFEDDGTIIAKVKKLYPEYIDSKEEKRNQYEKSRKVYMTEELYAQMIEEENERRKQEAEIERIRAEKIHKSLEYGINWPTRNALNSVGIEEWPQISEYTAREIWSIPHMGEVGFYNITQGMEERNISFKIDDSYKGEIWHWVMYRGMNSDHIYHMVSHKERCLIPDEKIASSKTFTR